MVSAYALSALFLTSYLIFHYEVGDVLFTGTGWIRPVYFAILIPHVILAVTILPLALTTLYFGLKSNFTRHRRIARWTWPLWIYVSVTGVIVYLMLYQLYTPNFLPPRFTLGLRARAIETASCHRARFFCFGLDADLVGRPKSIPTIAVMSAIVKRSPAMN